MSKGCKWKQGWYESLQIDWWSVSHWSRKKQLHLRFWNPHSSRVDTLPIQTHLYEKQREKSLSECVHCPQCSIRFCGVRYVWQIRIFHYGLLYIGRILWPKLLRFPVAMLPQKGNKTSVGSHLGFSITDKQKIRIKIVHKYHDFLEKLIVKIDACVNEMVAKYEGKINLLCTIASIKQTSQPPFSLKQAQICNSLVPRSSFAIWQVWLPVITNLLERESLFVFPEPAFTRNLHRFRLLTLRWKPRIILTIQLSSMSDRQTKGQKTSNYCHCKDNSDRLSIQCSVPARFGILLTFSRLTCLNLWKRISL